MAVFSLITSLVLGGIQQVRSTRQQLDREADVLRVAQMALQTGKTKLTVDGTTVTIEKTADGLVVIHDNKKVLDVQKN